MKVTNTRFAVICKEKPLRFDTYNPGEFSDVFEDAWLYTHESEALSDIKNMDCPDEFCVLPVSVSFDI